MEQIIELYYKLFNFKNVTFILILLLLIFINKEETFNIAYTYFNNNIPKISIFIPIYNAENTIIKSIQSLQNQTLKDIEIVAINDCSTDDSGKIMDEYSDKSIRDEFKSSLSSLDLSDIEKLGKLDLLLENQAVRNGSKSEF